MRRDPSPFSLLPACFRIDQEIHLYFLVHGAKMVFAFVC